MILFVGSRTNCRRHWFVFVLALMLRVRLGLKDGFVIILIHAQYISFNI